jgi:carbon storage regulator
MSYVVPERPGATLVDTGTLSRREAMLVLTRKAGEKIHIGDHITITLLSSHGGRVRIGIDAPPVIRVMRAELQGHPEALGERIPLPAADLVVVS